MAGAKIDGSARAIVVISVHVICGYFGDRPSDRGL